MKSLSKSLGLTWSIKKINVLDLQKHTKLAKKSQPKNSACNFTKSLVVCLFRLPPPFRGSAKVCKPTLERCPGEEMLHEAVWCPPWMELDGSSRCISAGPLNTYWMVLVFSVALTNPLNARSDVPKSPISHVFCSETNSIQFPTHISKNSINKVIP